MELGMAAKVKVENLEAKKLVETVGIQVTHHTTKSCAWYGESWERTQI
jgi:hypothetical protein